MTASTTQQFQKTKPVTPPDKYESWIQEKASSFPQFKALTAFLFISLETPAAREGIPVSNTSPGHQGPPSTKSTSLYPPTKSAVSSSDLSTSTNTSPSTNIPFKSNIFLVQFRKDSALKVTPVSENKLGGILDENEESQLFIVQDLSPHALKIFGGHWNVDPQFFLDYLYVVTREAASDRRQIIPTPWYRLGDIENHLPLLRSTDADMEHVTIRCIGPREYRPLNPKSPTPRVPDRFEPDLQSTYVERLGGGHNPIHAHSSSIWEKLDSIFRRICGGQYQSRKKGPKLWPVAMYGILQGFGSTRSPLASGKRVRDSDTK